MEAKNEVGNFNERIRNFGQKGSEKLIIFKITFVWDLVDDFRQKRSNIRSNSRKKMHIFCLFNDLKLLNAEINDLSSRFNTKLMLIQ